VIDLSLFDPMLTVLASPVVNQRLTGVLKVPEQAVAAPHRLLDEEWWLACLPVSAHGMAA